MQMRCIKNTLDMFLVCSCLVFVHPPADAYVIEDATYIERIYAWTGETNVFYGDDDLKPERIEEHYQIEDPESGSAFTFDSLSLTSNIGPTAEGRIQGFSSPAEDHWATVPSEVRTDVTYRIAVYNTYGTIANVVVPLNIDMVTYAEAQADGWGHAYAYSDITFLDFDVLPDDIPDGAVSSACMGVSFTRNCSDSGGERPGGDWDRIQSTIGLPVGMMKGDKNSFEVILYARVGVSLSANSDQPVQTGAAFGYAIADPVINIDPDWEHADKFELVLSPGVVQALPDLPAEPSSPPMPWLPLLLD